MRESLRHKVVFSVSLERGQDGFLRQVGAGSLSLGVRTLIEERLQADRTNSRTLALRDFLAAAGNYPEQARLFLESTSKQWENWDALA